MKKNKYQNLFYKKKTKRRYAIAAVLGVTALLGTAVLSLGQPPDAKTDSDAGLKSEVAYEASIAGSNIFSFIEGKISSSADKLVAKASATTNQSTADKAVSSQKFTPLVLRSSVDVTADGETKRISYIGHPTIEDILKKADITLSDTDTVSGSLSKAVTAGETIKVTRVEVSEEEELVEERKVAKNNKQYEKADEIRELIKQNGYNIKDVKNGNIDADISDDLVTFLSFLIPDEYKEETIKKIRNQLLEVITSLYLLAELDKDILYVVELNSLEKELLGDFYE